jgi:hypothetical protein
VRSLQRRTSGLAHGEVLSGFFGENGEFVVELPKELDVKGLGLRAAQVSDRTVSEVVDLEAAVEQAFQAFDPLGAVSGRPQAIGGGSMHELRRLSSPGGQAARAAAPTGFATREVDLSNDIRRSDFATWEKLGDLAKPDPIGPGAGHDLKKPSRGTGHAAQASAPTRSATRLVDLSNDIREADDFATWEKVADVANPDRIGGSGSKDELRRLSRRTPRTGR